jgi:phospholipid/cholesterol/gamma-HCH transport system permease protein
MQPDVTDDTDRATFEFERGGANQGTLILKGRLDRETTASIWHPSTQAVQQAKVPHLVVQAAHVTYCDGAGIALLAELKQIQRAHHGQTEIRDLRPEFQQLMTLFEIQQIVSPPKLPRSVGAFIRGVGQGAAGVVRELATGVTFTGEVFLKLLQTLAHPGRLRWEDTLIIAEKAGANAVGIVGLLGFLIGTILAFQMAAALRAFGAETLVADFVVIVLFRELGPLLTAVLLTSRTGSAFAAELDRKSVV